MARAPASEYPGGADSAPRLEKVGIVVSNGRTGTQFIAEYFDKNYDDVVALHEPRPSYALRFATHAYLAGRRTDEQMAALLRRKRVPLMKAISSRIYIESNSYLHGFIPVLDAVWDRPYVFHIVRDPRSYVSSALNHQTFVKNLLSRWVPGWLPDERKLLGIEGALSPQGRYAAYWRIINESIERTAAGMDRYHLIRFEDLFDESHTGLRRLCEVLSLDYRESGVAVQPDVRINASRSKRLGHWRAWPDEVCAEVQELCGPAMARYGYGNEKDWSDRVQAGGRS